jgi:DMSO/TMAO reductase YedYZ molybdopterin-dependent catalytic subunit
MGQPGEFDYDAARLDERIWALERRIGRRQFLVGLGTAAIVAACGGKGGEGKAAPSTATASTAPTASTAAANPGGWVKPVLETNFILHNTNAEMRWEQMRQHGYVTPNEQFFIRNHLATARIDRAGWRLRVEGTGVERPIELTYDELVKIPAETRVTRFVECAGNARVFFQEVVGTKAQGTQWRLGAIGVAEWTGVPLGAVLERAGVKRSARDVMPVGLDQLMVRRPMPLAKAMADDTLLVYGMNGADLPADHGAPVRALVPGWIGVANVKWVGKVEVSEQALYSDWNTGSYVLTGPGYQPEGPAKGPVITKQVVKSALELPWPATVPAGAQTLHGRSWSGAGRIARVEVRLDDGPWRRAQPEDRNDPTAWLRWIFPWDATPGDHKVSVRATDDQGNTQPDTVTFNEQGYAYGGVVFHPVTVK